MERFKQFALTNNLHVFDSEANFVLMEVPGSASVVTDKFLERGFIVRSGDALGVPGYIRVTVGTEVQNTGFFKAFDEILEGVGEER